MSETPDLLPCPSCGSAIDKMAELFAKSVDSDILDKQRRLLFAKSDLVTAAAELVDALRCRSDFLETLPNLWKKVDRLAEAVAKANTKGG